MFRGTEQIGEVVALLERRSASLWHACQLRDLRSYLEVGGVPSRSLLEQAGAGFTTFATDGSDRAKGLWSQVFTNLGDFGAAFARGWAAVPNPYGPIALQIRPSALLRASEVAICLRSAGAWDFDRDNESLDNVADVDRIFMNPIDANVFDRMEIRFGEALRRVFAPKHPNATSAELSASMEPELIPLDDVVVYWVDPIELGGINLFRTAAELVAAHRPNARVRERAMVSERRGVLDDVARFLADGGIPKLRLLGNRSDVSAATRQWAAQLQDRDLDWQFARYATYLVNGTFSELHAGGAVQNRDDGPVASAKARSLAAASRLPG